MATVDVLIPTMNRKAALAMTLTSLLGQRFDDFDVVISDQSPEHPCLESPEVQNAVDALRWHGHRVEVHHRPERRGMAEQRHFLLTRAHAPYAHYIDDDVILEPGVMERMLRVLREEGCGFVGCAAAGLRYLGDVRPEQEHIEIWDGPVSPEAFTMETLPTKRVALHLAANALHVERRLVRGDEVIRYKVAWVGGANVLFDRAKLLGVGGFSFWSELPPDHAGEDVLVQLLLMRRHGGCGILPCGTYHLCLPTNVRNRKRDATELLDRKLRELGMDREEAAPGGSLRDGRGRTAATGSRGRRP
jgi:GT2 family glycosyltransferase